MPLVGGTDSKTEQMDKLTSDKKVTDNETTERRQHTLWFDSVTSNQTRAQTVGAVRAESYHGEGT